MNQIEVSAKKVEDAINEGLRLLDTTIDNVTIEILSQGGLFKKAKVKMTVNEPLPSEKNNASKVEEKPQINKNPSQRDPRPVAPTEKVAPETVAESGKNKNPQPQNQKEQGSSFTKSVKNEEKQVKEPANKPAPSSSEGPRQPKREEKPLKTDEKAVKVPEEAEMKKAEDGNARENEASEDMESEEITITPETVSCADEFLKSLFEKMGYDVTVNISTENGLYIDLISPEVNLIGYRGETLDAIEYIVSSVVKKKGQRFVNVTVDSNNYRNKREKMLIEMARKKAEKCIKTGRRVILEPMNSSARKVIHEALANNDKVVTRSDGRDPRRHIVIYPKRDKKA